MTTPRRSGRTSASVRSRKSSSRGSAASLTSITVTPAIVADDVAGSGVNAGNHASRDVAGPEPPPMGEHGRDAERREQADQPAADQPPPRAEHTGHPSDERGTDRRSAHEAHEVQS